MRTKWNANTTNGCKWNKNTQRFSQLQILPININFARQQQQKKKNNSFKQSHHNGYKRLLKLLVEHLSADIDTRQPASVTGVTVIPADGVFQPANLQGHSAALSTKRNQNVIEMETSAWNIYKSMFKTVFEHNYENKLEMRIITKMRQFRSPRFSFYFTNLSKSFTSHIEKMLNSLRRKAW